MKKLTYLIFGALTATTLTACSDNDNLSATGEVSVQILTDNALASQTRAEVTPTQSIDLEVLDMNGDVVKSFADAVNTATGRFTLPVGNYVFHAFSSNRNNAAAYFDEEGQNAYYETRDTLAIAAGDMRTVKLVCTLATAKVSVNYTDELKANFTQLDCTVSGAAGSLLYNKEESRAGYFPASGDLTIQLDVTNLKGNTYTQTHTITGVKPRTHYRINYSLAESETGSGDFSISFDPTVNEMTFNVSISTFPYSVKLLEPDVYGKSAYFYATSELEDNTGLTFQYRLASADDDIWVSVPTTQKEVDGVATFVGTLTGLDFETPYVYRMAIADEEMSETGAFVTESYEEVPNLNFDSWSSVKSLSTFNKTVYYPNSDKSNSYWATGNTGLNSANTTVNSIPVDGRNGKAAQLKTVTVTMAGYAAGNIFIGGYKTDYDDGANSVKYGRSYEGARPLKLRGYYKYSPAAITNTTAARPENSDDYTEDTGDIYIKLWDGPLWSGSNYDWTDPAPNLIAEGHFYPTGTTAEYTEFEIPLTYLSKAKAKWMTIVCTSSRYGGEFDGLSVVGKVGVGSILWVDDFELVYE